MSLPGFHAGEARVVVLGPGAGAVVPMGATEDYMHLKVAGEDSANHLALLEYHAQPGSPGVSLHMHDGHEEGFYVIEGVLQMQLGDEVLDVRPGGFAFVPRGMAHRFGNPHPNPCVFLATYSPAGFEKFFNERVERLRHHPLDSDEIVELARAHGVTYLRSADEAARRP